MPNPQGTDQSFIKYCGSVVYDENEEYDMEEKDEDGVPRRRSFKKSHRLADLARR